ncbi:hypothetical protein MPL3365_170104 [Mesorhizobium plurifarium]|uniref:Uncharacterized protein n=1 Tax=Mesorhizobium plurifarium TaxID=69974 RepID=A0A090FZ47_MESPL|nr:hypothetical protein MPL3365_170104 [Mesorhizobium plurifarium]
MAGPIAYRRLEEFPNINAMQLFEEFVQCSFRVGLPGSNIKRSRDGSVAGVGQLARVALSWV